MQFHSTLISEPAAQICGLVMGLITYGIASLVTADHNSRLWAAMVASVLTNLVIGAKINILTLDFLALIFVRPVSAAAGAGILALMAQRFAGG